jgi:integrase
MSDFARQVQNYLKLRRALGFKLTFEGRVLPQLVAYLDHAGASTLTAELAIAWAGLPEGVRPISLAHRLGAARGFAKYLQTIDPATEVPPCGVWPSVTLRPIPYLWSATDIGRLLEAARRLRPPLRAATYECLLGLVAASGMRIGEALALRRDDVDLAKGVVTVREAKFGRIRLVPLHPSVTEALRSYTAYRAQVCTNCRSTRLFISDLGTTLDYARVSRTFVQLTAAIGLRTTIMRPRIHDLRHSFAVNTLIRWHRSGVDIGAHMAVLSNYLGHVNPAGTYWYLSAAPELMELAAARLDDRYGAPR